VNDTDGKQTVLEMMLQCARKDVATGFISGNLAQNTVHSQGKEGKFAFALQSQELFQVSGCELHRRDHYAAASKLW
jgi:hypothetical protein